MISRREALTLSGGAALAAAAAGVSIVGASKAAATQIRIATQKTGTFAWELQLMRERDLLRGSGVDLDIVELASPDAGRVALRGGSADLIVTDLTWIARQRALGDKLLFYPYSSTIGSVVVAKESDIATLRDLRGKKLGVAGGPLDKSFVLLNALAARDSVDLRREAQLVFGAPPLLTQKMAQGELDALLTYWNFAAWLQARDFRQLVGMDEVQMALGARAPIAFLGYGFSDAFAQKNRAGLDAFLRAARQTKEMIARENDAWAQVAQRTGATDEKERAILRRLYAAGVPQEDEGSRADALRMLALLDAAEGGKLGAPGEALFYSMQP